ncbi:unnamed protein product [Alopecurus aequalis]
MGSRKRQQQSEPTTPMSLGDDMLAEILRRLPSLTSLARAAFACPRLRIVVSSSSVAKRPFSPAPLLGYFISVDGGDTVRCGDFHLTGFEDYDWRLMDCRHGLLLLTSDRCMAVFDPLSRSRLRIPHCTSTTGDTLFAVFLPASGDDATSFRVLCLEGMRGGRVRVHVYSSCTGEWCRHSRAPKGIKLPQRGDEHPYHSLPLHAGGHPHDSLPMHAGGRIYWRTRAEAEMLTSLDVCSMELSNLALPDELHQYYSSLSSSYAVGGTEDGTTCLVAVSFFPINTYHQHLGMRVWFLKEEDGWSSWELQWRVDASEWDLLAHGSRGTKVCDVTAGIVLLCTGYKKTGFRYFAIRLKDILEDNAIDAIERQSLLLADFFTSAGWVHPYFMAWPRPSLKAAGSTDNASTIESGQEAAAAFNKKEQV